MTYQLAPVNVVSMHVPSCNAASCCNARHTEQFKLLMPSSQLVLYQAKVRPAIEHICTPFGQGSLQVRAHGCTDPVNALVH
jgi:hypothetical protein